MSTKSTFDLRINPSQLKEINLKYGFSSSKTTMIEVEPQTTIVFSDDTRKVHKCLLSKIEPGLVNTYSCFWCRHPCTESHPVACPIKYNPTVVYKNYVSEINREHFLVKEYIALDDVIPPDVNVTEQHYYDTDGIFCSLPCALAFARDNRHNAYYADSEFLLHHITKKKIDCAPHWRMLKEYGGHLTIKDFREASTNHDYIDFGIHVPSFNPTSRVFEQKMKF